LNIHKDDSIKKERRMDDTKTTINEDMLLSKIFGF
jgi:hypothetical protein